PNRVVHVHMQQAFALLTDEIFREKWSNHYACKEFPFAKSMFQNIEVAEFFEQRRLASLIQFDSEFSEFPQSVIAGAASKRRQKLAKDDSDLRRQMGVAEAARF